MQSMENLILSCLQRREIMTRMGSPGAQQADLAAHGPPQGRREVPLVVAASVCWWQGGSCRCGLTPLCVHPLLRVLKGGVFPPRSPRPTSSHVPSVRTVGHKPNPTFLIGSGRRLAMIGLDYLGSTPSYREGSHPKCKN